MKRRNGFTLIELLAVIIILGILMIIAIPSVTNYINNSRKSAYIDTAKEIVSGARNLVNQGDLEMFDSGITYYISAECIKTEGANRSPYGEFKKAYVVVTYDGKGYNYYWTSIDETGQGIKTLTKLDQLDEDDIVSNLNETDIIDTIGVYGRDKYMIINQKDTNCGRGETSNVTGYAEDEYITFPEGKNRSSLSAYDIVTIGTEDFYFIRYDGNNLVLLAKYNLKVGDIYYRNQTINKVVYNETYDSNDEGYGIQSSEAAAYNSSYEYYRGVMPYSETNYWHDDYSGIMYVYGSDSNLYTYIENYKQYLSKFNVYIREARLLNENEYNKVGRLKDYYFWTGVATGDDTIACVQSGGGVGFTGYKSEWLCGVRPVIVV